MFLIAYIPIKLVKINKPNTGITPVDEMEHKLVAVLCFMLLISTVSANVTQGHVRRALRTPTGFTPQDYGDSPEKRGTRSPLLVGHGPKRHGPPSRGGEAPKRHGTPSPKRHGPPSPMRGGEAPKRHGPPSRR